MIEIPLERRNNAIYVSCRINGYKDRMEFQVDTGSPVLHISKELADILFLMGKLDDSDITGNDSISYGRQISLVQDCVTIKTLTIGKVRIKNVKAMICRSYGGADLLGMSVLDKMGDYSIKRDKILINDGKEDVVVTNSNEKIQWTLKKVTNYYYRVLNKLNKFDGAKIDYRGNIDWLSVILQTGKRLNDNRDFGNCITLLKTIEPYVKENLMDDEQHPTQRGAFFSAYFYLHLAMAYFVKYNEYTDAVKYFNKAKIFFPPNTSTYLRIENTLEAIRKR